MGFEAGGSRQDGPSRTHDWPDNDPTVELDGEECSSAPVSSALDDTPTGGPAAIAASRGSTGDEPLARGSILRDRYLLEEVIGHGGRSIVYRARDLRLEADDASAAVAIKTLRPEFAQSEGAVARLKSEFRILRSLTCPGVVRVFDLDRDGTTWFAVMELLEGHSLAELLRDPAVQAAPAQRKLDTVTACAEALAAVHEQGLAHGDIKPGNTFVTYSGSVRLLDFGASSAPLPGQEASSGASVATPAYASPQVLSGSRAEARDDMFSLCCMASELLTGRHPFDRLDSLEARRRGLAPAGLDTLDAATAAALGRGLAWEREDRPASVRQLLLMMREASGEAVVKAAPPTTDPRGRYLPRRPATWILVLLLALLVPAAIAIWLQGDPEPTRALAPEPAPPTELQPPAAVEPASVPEAGAVVPEPEPPAAAPHLAPAEAAASKASGPRFAFEADSVSVSRAASAAALRLRRDGPTNGRAIVAWRIVEGSARAGRDFAGPTTGTLSFADGQATSTLFIPLLEGSTGDASFTVEVTAPGGDTDAGPMARVTVQILRLMPAGEAATRGTGEAAVPNPPG